MLTWQNKENVNSYGYLQLQLFDYSQDFIYYSSAEAVSNTREFMSNQIMQMFSNFLSLKILRN